MTRTPQTLIRLALATCVAALAAGAALAPAAAAKSASTPCWKVLINDWYDGRIDHTYPVHCYKEALKHLPTDVRTYSDAYDVISRALAAATHGKKHVSQNTAVPPPPGNGGGGGGSGGAGGGTTPKGKGGGSGVSTTGVNTTGGSQSIFGQATGKLGSNSASSLPIPLLVLAGLALLLVAAGAAGLLARRVQAKRAGDGRRRR